MFFSSYHPENNPSQVWRIQYLEANSKFSRLLHIQNQHTHIHRHICTPQNKQSKNKEERKILFYACVS